MTKDPQTPWSDDNQPGQNPSPGKTPAPWQRSQQDGEAFDPAIEGRATHLADDQMSLGSKLTGGGRDQAEGGAKEEMRLCPACKGVHTFINDVCSSCKHKVGAMMSDIPQPAEFSPMGADIPWGKLIGGLVGIIVIALIVIFVVMPMFQGGGSGGGDPASNGTRASNNRASDAPFRQISLDDGFHRDLVKALESGNAGWEAEGVDCYAYRYSIFENVDPGKAQSIWVTAYLGGDDAESAVDEPASAFRRETADYVNEMNSRTGISSSISLEFTDGAVTPEAGSVYIRYGYYYGKEHIEKIQPIMDALENLRKENGQYPLQLMGSIVRPSFKTNGGFNFVANGFGYIPIFKTDSDGNIIMGTGAGRASFEPEECLGYYLLMYIGKKTDGLDFHNRDDERYYYDKISPFPYAPKSKLQNTPLNPDGEPDGIACVVKSGVLLKD